MSIISNDRQHPITQQVNWRELKEVHIVEELTELGNFYGIRLFDYPNTSEIEIYEFPTGADENSPSTWGQQITTVQTTPNAGQAQPGNINQSKSGIVFFNQADDGLSVIVVYEGGGTVATEGSIGIIVDNKLVDFGVQEKETITLADDAQININAIFDTARDGEYLIMWDFDPLTWGRIQYTQGSPSNATIVDGSANFVSGDVDTNLCLVQVVDDIFLKNRLGDEYDFVIYRRGV
jgi:hypothetical protein